MSDRIPLPAPGHDVIINGPSPHDWILTYELVALVTLAALPIAALTTWWLARSRRRAGNPRTSAWRTAVADVGLVYGTLPWLWLTLMPAGNTRTAHGTVSLVPLRDLGTMPTYQILGNLLILAALGCFAPLRFPAMASLPRILAFAATCSVLIETAQYALRLDRVSSVDDVLLNTLGAGLTALVSRPWWHGRVASGGPAQPFSPNGSIGTSTRSGGSSASRSPNTKARSSEVVTRTPSTPNDAASAGQSMLG